VLLYVVTEYWYHSHVSSTVLPAGTNMPTYKRTPGSRPYLTNYSKARLDQVLRRVSAGMSIHKASKKFHIPYGTLYHKVCNFDIGFKKIDHEDLLYISFLLRPITGSHCKFVSLFDVHWLHS